MVSNICLNDHCAYIENVKSWLDEFFIVVFVIYEYKKESRFVSNPRSVGNVLFDEYDDNMYNAKLNTS